MPTPNDRIDGWKAIGAYFGRDRTTAIRWAKARGLPVHALPGGKTRTVYALRGELDAWRSGAPAYPDADAGLGPDPGPDPNPSPDSGVRAGLVPDAPEPGSRAPPPRRPVPLARASAALAGAGLAIGLLAAPMGPGLSGMAGGGWTRGGGGALALPADPSLARRYIEARDELARRDAPGLSHALAELRAVARADPGFAPARASLADGYLLAREFGALDDADAFPRAAAAARAALRLDGALPPAHRALALIAYWWNHDPVAAAAGFRRALALDGDDALTHLWFANVLADNGDAPAAAREFAAAKLRQPGLPSIGIDEAWAIWSAGDDARAQTMLDDLARRNPMLASPHDCLSMVALARGDLRGYARELAIRARLRGEQALTAYARAVGSAVARGDIDALSMLMAARAQTVQAGLRRGDEPLAVFFQSALGRRAALVVLLKRAEDGHERWPGAGFRLHIARRWQNDAEVMRLLRRRAPPPIA